MNSFQLTSGNNSLRDGALPRFCTKLARNMPFAQKSAYLVLNFILKRLKCRFLAETVYGAKMACDGRDFIQRMICNFGYWEPDITDVVMSILKPGDIFIDIGANVGYYSLLGSKRVGDRGRVFSIEAHPEIFRLLEENLSYNQPVSITAINIAAGRTNHVTNFYAGPNTSLGVSSIRERPHLQALGKIMVKPITEIVPKDMLCKVTLIKIDVEGAEADVLSDILENISDFSEDLAIIVELSLDNVEREEIFKELRAVGFNAYGINNEYDDLFYLNWTSAQPPKILEKLPHEQVDLLFIKTSYRRRDRSAN